MISYKERLNHVTTFMFDVDGVLTNGDVLLMNGDVYRTLNSKDGYALQYASKKGYKIFIVTGGNSLDVKHRLDNLGVTEVHLRSADKLQVYEQICEKYQLRDEEVLYMGDDIPDLPILKRVGVSTCPQDAVPEVKAASHYQSPLMGGKACVRDVIEQVLKVQNTWMTEEAYHW